MWPLAVQLCGQRFRQRRQLTAHARRRSYCGTIVGAWSGSAVLHNKPWNLDKPSRVRTATSFPGSLPPVALTRIIVPHFLLIPLQCFPADAGLKVNIDWQPAHTNMNFPILRWMARWQFYLVISDWSAIFLLFSRWVFMCMLLSEPTA